MPTSFVLHMCEWNREIDPFRSKHVRVFPPEFQDARMVSFGEPRGATTGFIRRPLVYPSLSFGDGLEHQGNPSLESVGSTQH